MPELCDKCHLRPAVIHIRAAGPNGQLQAYNLCPSCAMAMMAGGEENADGLLQAIQTAVKASGVDFSQLLDGDFLSIAASAPEKSCPHCKTKLSHLKERHLLGCPECLETFRETIRDLLGSDLEEQRHHRRSATLMLNQTPEQLKRTLDGQELKRRFQEAVRTERYEQAAALKKLMDTNSDRLLAISRQREHNTDEAAERAAIDAFLAMPPPQNTADGEMFRQPWLPWEPHVAPSGQRPQIRLSSFVNFSRNLAEFPLPPFHGRNKPDAEEVCTRLQRALLKDPLFADAEVFAPSKIDRKTKYLLHIGRLSPGDFLSRPYATRLLLSRNHRLVARINYLDHLQILLWGGPDDFIGNTTLMAALERRLQRTLIFATDSEFGSISRDVHSLGSGINLGCFLHLPATCFDNCIEAHARACDALHVRFRSLFTMDDEDDEDVGGIYSIRTTNAMGDTLANRCQLIRRTALQLERHELEIRETLQRHPEHRVELIDRIARTVGIVKNARIMTINEARTYLSLLWFGAELGMLPELDLNTLQVAYTVTSEPQPQGKGYTAIQSARFLAHVLRMMMQTAEPAE